MIIFHFLPSHRPNALNVNLCFFMVCRKFAHVRRKKIPLLNMCWSGKITNMMSGFLLLFFSFWNDYWVTEVCVLVLFFVTVYNEHRSNTGFILNDIQWYYPCSNVEWNKCTESILQDKSKDLNICLFSIHIYFVLSQKHHLLGKQIKFWELCKVLL